ncbi:MAG TPA: sigma-54-dependent Fis family transcriptional regulator, partial [Terriglobales bacterium]
MEHFAQQISAVNGWKPIPFRAEAIEALKGYGWPGNIRELRNIVERLLLLTSSDEVDSATVVLALPTDAACAMPSTAAEQTGALSAR